MPPWFARRTSASRVQARSVADRTRTSRCRKWSWGRRAATPPTSEGARFRHAEKWQLGEPDLIVISPDVAVPAWARQVGIPGMVPTGSPRIVTVVRRSARGQRHPGRRATSTVGKIRVSPHDLRERGGRRGGIANAESSSTSWPIHEVAATPTSSRPGGAAAAKNSSLALSAYHLHSNGRQTKAHLEFAFRFFRRATILSTSARRAPRTASTST